MKSEGNQKEHIQAATQRQHSVEVLRPEYSLSYLLGRSTNTFAQAISCAARGCNRVLVDIGEHGFQDRQVDDLCAAESGELEPDDEDCLESKIPWEVIKHQTECNAFREVEEAKDDPVCKPLDVILVSGGLDRLERKVCWNRPSNEGRHRASEGVHEVEKKEEEKTAKDGIGFRNLGALFKRIQNWIFRELLVEL